ncbi:hypothetical protein [Gottschalkia acidurici]|uniref:hypothetical protein n=1 Tax=Clostridium acidurici TaxID=1556 RepID=UPI0011872B8C|nr:hypothetical protein [Gottschalkia acidurici]
MVITKNKSPCHNHCNRNDRRERECDFECNERRRERERDFECHDRRREDERDFECRCRRCR